MNYTKIKLHSWGVKLTEESEQHLREYFTIHHPGYFLFDSKNSNYGISKEGSLGSYREESVFHVILTLEEFLELVQQPDAPDVPEDIDYSREYKTIQEWLDLLVNRDLANEIFSDMEKSKRLARLKDICTGDDLINLALIWEDVGKYDYYKEWHDKIITDPKSFYKKSNETSNELNYELY